MKRVWAYHQQVYDKGFYFNHVSIDFSSTSELSKQHQKPSWRPSSAQREEHQISSYDLWCDHNALPTNSAVQGVHMHGKRNKFCIAERNLVDTEMAVNRLLFPDRDSSTPRIVYGDIWNLEMSAKQAHKFSVLGDKHEVSTGGRVRSQCPTMHPRTLGINWAVRVLSQSAYWYWSPG